VEDERIQRFAARLPTLPWLAILLATVYGLGRSLFGEPAAHAATLAAALDPNLMAHASLATNDIAFTAATLLTLAAAVRLAKRPSPASAVLLGLALGLAFAAKFNAVLLLPSLLVLPLALTQFPRRAWRSVGRFAGILALVAAGAALAIGSAYLFRGLCQPLSSQRWMSTEMKWLAQACPSLAPPLPAGFLTGLDVTLGFQNVTGTLLTGHRRVDWPVLLLGHQYPGGVWFYFVLLWLLKTPLLVVAAVALGLGLLLRKGLLLTHPGARYLAASLAVWLVYLSFFLRAQIGYRFALLCIPPACLLAGAGLATLTWPAGRRMGLAVVLVSLLENVLYAGNPLSFTSAAVWPKRRVFRLMADSNVDWGQNANRIEDWVKEARVPDPHLDPPHIVPGHNVFDLNKVAGVFDFEQHRWLREHVDPVDHFGHTHLWFWIDDPTFERFVYERRRLVPLPLAASLCAGAGTRYAAGSRPEFQLSGNPSPGEAWIVCAETAREGARLGLRAVRGHVRLGPVSPDRVPRWDTLEEGQVVWYVLEPGLHAFGLAQIPNRRAWLPNDLDGRWLVRGRGVSMSTRPAHLNPDGSIEALGGSGGA
jgi:hypothetical protein